MAFTSLLYSQPSFLVYHCNRSGEFLLSREGVHQGDPLGPFYFCAAINHILLHLQESHRDVLLAAYFDEVNIMGPPEMIGQVFPALFEGLESCGLKLNIKKSELFHRDAGSVDWAAGMKLSDGGDHSPWGSCGFRRFCHGALPDCLEGWSRADSGYQGTRVQAVCFRYCRISHLTRLSPPCETASAARLHDDVMEDTLKALLGVEHLSDHVRTEIHIRTRDGGLGLFIVHFRYLTACLHRLVGQCPERLRIIFLLVNWVR